MHLYVFLFSMYDCDAASLAKCSKYHTRLCSVHIQRIAILYIAFKFSSLPGFKRVDIAFSALYVLKRDKVKKGAGAN